MISIDMSSFPAEGGEFTIQITKDDNWSWVGVTIAPEAWANVLSSQAVSNFLWEVVVDIDRNNTGSSRSLSIGVATEDESEFFTLSQPTESVLSINIANVTPAGNFASSGGTLTVDVESVNGQDSLSSYSIVTGIGYVTHISTTHNVSSGGLTVTRFVFSISANSNPTTRSIVIAFQVSDGNGNTDSANVSKSQLGEESQSGSLSATDVSVDATDTNAQSLLTLSDIDTSTISASSSDAWVTGLNIQVSGGQYFVFATLDENTSASQRQSTITVTATDNYGNALTTTFVLTQEGAGASHSISTEWKTALGYDGVVGYEGGTEEASITYQDNFTGDAICSFPPTTGVSVILVNNNTLQATYAGGEIPNTIQVPITISRVGDDGVTYSTQIVFILQASGVFPIWRDKKIELVSDEDFEDYELTAGGEVFYTGRAFKYPNEANISVNIARVVAPYLTTYFKEVGVWNRNTLLALLTFVRDYSYDPTIDYKQDNYLNRPINGRIPSGIKVSASEWGAGYGTNMQVLDENGNLVVNQALVKGLNVNEWISGSVGKKYLFGGEMYEVVNTCRGVLFKYVNAYGAMDFFLVENVCKKTDKITRATYEKDADALSLDFETKDYQSEMEGTWQGTTGWLSDRQSLRMKHLVESVEVYMVDLETGEEKPVVMTDNSLPYKTFYKNGKKLVNYTLQWSESQKKIRR